MQPAGISVSPHGMVFIADEAAQGQSATK